jgi:histidinol-phosphate aminotransferase
MKQSAAWKAKASVVRPEVAAAPPYNSGLTIEEVVRRYNPPKISKLGSGENPFGASPKIAAVLANFDISLYPDPAGLALRAAIAGGLGTDVARVILGNGSEDLIEVVCRAILRSGDEVVTLYPSFPLHEIYPEIQGARVTRVPVRDDFSIDEEALHAAVAHGPRMLMFANPMNPVGSFLDREAFARLCSVLPASTVLVLDEAYVEYAEQSRFPDALSALAALGNPYIVLRTFSKAYGLAGIRLGYGITSDDEFTEILDRVRTPFNVNAIAQAMGLVALADLDHVAMAMRHNAAERARVADALRELGARTAPSQGNFLFFSMGRPSSDVAEGLLKQGVIVKPWQQNGYSDFCRVTLGSVDANDHFLSALRLLTKAA